MSGYEFVKWYLIFISPSVILILISAFDRLKHRKLKSVRVYAGLTAICHIGSFVALFASLSNGLAYFYSKDSELWFVITMSVCYIGLISVLIMIHDERIIYSIDSGDILAHKNFKSNRFNVSEITRIYLSDEYLDIYLGKKRIRYGNNFLKDAEDFESFVKEYMTTCANDRKH